MTLKIGVSLVALALLNITLFQNCGALKADEKLKQKETSGTGQPYDGKIFVVAGTGCVDGTFVQSRLVVDTATQATLVRENCQDTSRSLGPDEFYFDSNDAAVVHFNNVAYAEEKPWTPIPLLSTWYYQLTGTLQSNSALIYDIDLFETSAAQIRSLKLAGHIVTCNFSSGTFENWRPDAAAFPAAALGNSVGAGEKWVDIRDSAIRALMVQRMDLAQTKGCDAVDLDSADVYANGSGFPITKPMQISYNRDLAFAAHDRHLIVALKNTADLVADLSESYDFAIAEECFRYNECGKFQAFTGKGKAVLAAEFTAYSPLQCGSANEKSISLSFLSRALDGSSFSSCP